MEIAAVILCAGKGTRMNDNSKNKVCFDCAGVPVIRRIVNNMRQGGIRRFVLVVGHQAQTVMEALGGESGIAYAYQKEQRGTGDAARCGIELLSTLGFRGRVMVAMGDKIISPGVIASMVRKAGECQALWGVQHVTANWGGGRVVVCDGEPYGVVEWADVAYQAIAGQPEADWQDILNAMRLNDRKAAKVIKRAADKPGRGYVELNGRRFSAKELQRVPYANASLYCFDMKKILEALDKCHADNAQNELYLTDTLEYFASRHQARIEVIERPEEMLTFSTKSELREISAYFLKSASEYLMEISSGKWQQRLAEVYGDAAVERQQRRYERLLSSFIEIYGDRKVVVTRSPGRVNLMGRHIDHRGGCTNVMTLDRDVILVASRRDNDSVSIANMDAAYPASQFSIADELAKGVRGTDWLEYLESPRVAQALKLSRGYWGNYIKAAVLRLQYASDLTLCGMNILVDGDIPQAAGLSSSSALVVATALAVQGLNCLNLPDQNFIELCGEGEWFVGSRGGSGDHAAMKCGRKNAVTQLHFQPFFVGESVPFSDRYAILVANSGVVAKKSEGAKDVFNARVAASECAFMYLRKLNAQRGWRVFRELAEMPSEKDVYMMLKLLPEHATRGDIYKLLPSQKEKLDRIFATHNDVGDYALREITLYGISECVRANCFAEFLKSGDYDKIGALMNISHDGDRVTAPGVSDEDLERYIREKTPLWQVTGAYRCSLPLIDEMCDLLKAAPGVLGCSLVGAGLGGSVIALVKSTAAERLMKKLEKHYYEKNKLSSQVNIFRPGDGAKLFVD